MKAVNEGTKCFRTSGGLILAQLSDSSFEDKEIRLIPDLEHNFFKRIGLESDYIILGLPNWESGLYLLEIFDKLKEKYREIDKKAMALGVHQESIFKNSDKSTIIENIELNPWDENDEDDSFPSKNSKNHIVHFCFRKKGIIYVEDLLSDYGCDILMFVNRDLIGKEIFPVELYHDKNNWLVPYTEEDMELMNRIDHDDEEFTFIPSFYSSFKIEEHRKLLSI